MPISPQDYAGSLMRRIAEVRQSTKKGEILDAREDSVLRELSNELAQLVKATPPLEHNEGTAYLKRIMHNAYFQEYIEGRARSAIGKTDKSKLLKLFEDKIYYVANELLNPKRERFEKAKNSFETDLAESITDPQTVKMIFDTALINIVIVSHTKNDLKATQQFANAMKLVERFSNQGKLQFNQLAADLGADTAMLLNVTTKSRSESELKSLLTQLTSNQAITASAITYVNTLPPPPPRMSDDDIPPPPPREPMPPPPRMTDDDVPPPPPADDNVPPPPRSEPDFSDTMNDPYFPPPPAGMEIPSLDDIPPPPPVEDIPSPPPPIPQASGSAVPPPVPQKPSAAVPPPVPPPASSVVPSAVLQKPSAAVPPPLPQKTSSAVPPPVPQQTSTAVPPPLQQTSSAVPPPVPQKPSSAVPPPVPQKPSSAVPPPVPQKPSNAVPPPVPQQPSGAVPPPVPQQSSGAVPPPVSQQARATTPPPIPTKPGSPTHGQGMFEKKLDPFRDELTKKLRGRNEGPADDSPKGPKK